MQGLDTVIFDVDGTLLDTSEGITHSILYTAKQLGLEPPPPCDLRAFIGPPIQNSFKSYYAIDDVTSTKAASIFREHYKEVSLFEAAAYPGIYETLGTLKNSGMKLAVATYKREDYALMILRHFGFDSYFSVMLGSDMDGNLSKADIIRLCMAELGAQAERTVYVGDTKGDLYAAQSAEVNFVGVCYGFGFSEKPLGCTDRNMLGFADSPAEISIFFADNNEST